MEELNVKKISILDLPDEILLRIFGFYIQKCHQRNLITLLSKVCRIFRNICYDPFLWKTVSASLSIDDLKILSSRGSFSCTKELHFDCDDIRIPDEDIDGIFSCLPQLEIVNFREVKVMKESYFLSLIKHCPRINRIDFSSINDTGSYSVNLKKIKGNHLSKFLEVRGTDIVSINLSECYILSLPLLLKTIARCCPNLTEFVLLYSGNPAVIFPVNSFKNLCPKLKTLRFDSNVCFEVKCSRANANGFPELETFAYYDFTENGNIYDRHFLRILCKSSKLKFLDLHGCVHINCDSLLTLPADKVEYLCISGLRIMHLDVLIQLLLKWRSSLKFLDLSWIKMNFIDEVVSCISSLEKLEKLNLNGTSVSLNCVRTLITHCTTLKELHLESCRELKRTFKRVYRGKCELEVLLKKIDHEY